MKVVVVFNRFFLVCVFKEHIIIAVKELALNFCKFVAFCFCQFLFTRMFFERYHMMAASNKIVGIFIFNDFPFFKVIERFRFAEITCRFFIIVSINIVTRLSFFSSQCHIWFSVSSFAF